MTVCFVFFSGVGNYFIIEMEETKIDLFSAVPCPISCLVDECEVVVWLQEYVCSSNIDTASRHDLISD